MIYICVFVCAENVPDISGEGTALTDNFLFVSLSNRTVVFTVTDLSGGDDLVIILGPTVPVGGSVLHCPVITAGPVAEFDVEGVAPRHLQRGEVQLSLVLTAVELVVLVVANLTHQLSLLSPVKMAGMVLHSFTLHTPRV